MQSESLYLTLGRLRQGRRVLHITASHEVVDTFRELFRQFTGVSRPDMATLRFNIDQLPQRYTIEDSAPRPTSWEPSIYFTAPLEKLEFNINGFYSSQRGHIIFDRFTFEVWQVQLPEC